MPMLSRSSTFLRLEFFFSLQKVRKEFEQIGLQNPKNMWRENVLAHARAPLARKYTNRVLESQDGTTSTKY